MTESEKDSQARNHDLFVTTHWSVVLAAREPETSRRALENLCTTYWRPVYAYILRSVRSPHDAQDLTQEFFSCFLEQDFLQNVAPEKGRFRAFLLACTKHFLSNEFRRANAAKRGGRCTFISWEEMPETSHIDLTSSESTIPSVLFDKEWAMTLVNVVMERLKTECSKNGKEESFQVLRVYLGGDPSLTHAEAGMKLGMSPEAVQVAIHRLRRRYGELLRQEIAQIVSTPEEIDSEIRYLFAALRH